MQLATTNVFKKLQRENKNLHILTDEEVKEVQKIELETLEDIINICNEHQVNYHLTGGSALGAVRHHGFIPWDDDVDIDMARKDIPVFLREFEKKYGDKYWIHTPETKGQNCMQIIHIRRKGTVFQGCGDPSPEECGICVDILAMENTFDNSVVRFLHGTVSMALGLIVSCRRFYLNKEYMLKIAGNDEEALSSFKAKIRIGWFTSFLSLEKWVKLYDRWNALCNNEKSKYVTVPTGKEKYFKATYLRSAFAETVEGQFEGHSVKLPKETDSYLTHLFGDYMIVPPKEEQEQHALVRFDINVKSGRGGVILRFTQLFKSRNQYQLLGGAA